MPRSQGWDGPFVRRRGRRGRHAVISAANAIYLIADGKSPKGPLISWELWFAASGPAIYHLQKIQAVRQ